MLCEERLIKLCHINNFLDVCQVADMYNANRLKEFCAWFQRINPKVNEILYQHMQADESSVDIHGKGDNDEKKLLKNPQSLFGFLDCKNMSDEDDSSMHEGSECEVPYNNETGKVTEKEQAQNVN